MVNHELRRQLAEAERKIERLKFHAEAMAIADSCATYEDVANELRAAVMTYCADFPKE